MGKAGKRSKDGAKAADKSGDKAEKPPAPPQDDEFYEDGDIATPKLDRYGSDDEPL